MLGRGVSAVELFVVNIGVAGSSTAAIASEQGPNPALGRPAPFLFERVRSCAGACSVRCERGRRKMSREYFCSRQLHAFRPG